MKETQWGLVSSLFDECLALPENEWEAFLGERCAGDRVSIDEVLAMLRADARGNSVLDRAFGNVAASLLEASDGPAADLQIGPYRLLRLLGEGGMGVVWLARREDANAQVAIKFLPHAGLSPARRERFAGEIRTLAKLRHSYIARLYDAGTLSDGTPWFVMEYVDGIVLTEFCAQQKPGIAERLSLFHKICEAVQYAHSQEIIHRDLKPSNIMVEGDGTPRLLDFGIARELHVTGEGTDQTRRGFRFHSPFYAAPEWVREGKVGFVTDVYSLGVILYQMLTERLPFADAEQPSEQHADASPSKQPPRPSAIAKERGWLGNAAWNGLDLNDLDVLCLTAMHLDPEKRYRSVEALVRDLDHYHCGQPLDARPDSTRYRMGKFLRRNRGRVAAASLAFISIACMVLYFTVKLSWARDAALAEETRLHRIQHFMLNMLGNGDVEAGPANELRVVTLLDREAEQAASLNADPQTQQELLQTLGTMYDRLGEWDKSERMLSLALRTSERTGKYKERDQASILVQRAILLGDEGKTDEAKRDLQQAQKAIVAGRIASDDALAIESQLARGRIAEQSGEYEEAIKILSPFASMDGKRGGGSSYDTRDGLSYLAVAALHAQHFDMGESAGRRAVALDRELLGESHPQTGTDIVNLASDRASVGDFAGAEALYREGIASMKAWYGPDHPDVVTASGILARILVKEDKDAEAEPILLHVLDVQERSYGETDPRVGFTLNALGEVAMKRGDLVLAEKDFNRSASIFAGSLGKSNVLTAGAESNLGNVYLKQAKYARAEVILRDAVESLGPLPSGNNVLGTIRARWGRALLGLKKYTEAETQLRAAYDLLQAQRQPQPVEIAKVREDLAALYRATGQPQMAKDDAPSAPASAPVAAAH